MLGVTIVYIFVSALISGICFLTTDNIFITVGVFAIYVLYFYIYLRKRFVKYFSLIGRAHSCYFFINSFIITMSVKESYSEAFDSGIRIEDKNLHIYTKELNELSPSDKVTYLRSYFKLSIYKMFLNILEIYDDQGGNILTMTENIIKEATRMEKTISQTVSIGNKHLIEFILLWAMSFGVLLFMRFGVSDFYQMMLKNPIFVPLLVVFFLICLVSVHLFFQTFTNLTIKEDNLEWKK